MSKNVVARSFLIEGDGEMVNLINNHNWSLSALGSMQYWPRNLFSTVDLLLNSAFPMFLFWGKDHVCFYNDAFRPALGIDGKHPGALGSSGKLVWNEIWQTIEPLINHVRQGKSTALYEDQYIPIYRNGKIDDAYWTFSYNPVKDDDGIVQGVLAIVHESTNKVKQNREADALRLQLHQALEACDLGTFDLDPETMKFSCNDKTKELFGFDYNYNIDLNAVINIIHTDDREVVRNSINQSLNINSGGKFDVEFSIAHAHSYERKRIRVKGKTYFNIYNEPERLGGTIQDITQEKELELRKRKLQLLVDNSTDFMSMATLDGHMTYLNAAAKKLVGLDEDANVSLLQVKDFYSDAQFKKIKEDVIPVLDKQKKWGGVINIRHFKTGEEIPCYSNYILITDPDTGNIISRAATFRDLRAELTARKELEESDKRFKNLVQEAPVATAVYIGKEMRIQWANDAMIKTWGKDKSVIGKTIREALPELEGQPFHQQLDNVFTTGEMYQGTEDVAHLFVDGKLQAFYFNFSYKPLRDAEGNIYGILNMAIDVTESIKVKRQLQESDKNFRNLIMQAPIGITLLAGNDHIVELANDEYLELVGRERAGFAGKPIWELIPEAKEQGFDIILKNVKETGEPFFGNEIPIMLVRNGIPETVYINFVYEPLFDEQQSVHSILVIAINVTQQVQSRKQVEMTEERERLAIESARLGAYEVDMKTLEVHASPRMYELYDVEPTTKHYNFIEQVDPADLEARQKAHEVALTTGKLEYQCRILRKDGSKNWIHVFGQYYFDKNGIPEKVIGIVKDITEEKATESELEKRVKERTEELTKLNEELQQFTYISTHDLKEPLRKVQFFSSRLRHEVKNSDSTVLNDIDKIITSSERMSTLINDLLNYSTLSDKNIAFEKVALSEVVKNIREDMEVMINEKNATIYVDEIPSITGIRFQLNQLFYNLLNNALKFCKAEVSPVIKIRCTILDDEEKRQFPSLTNTEYYKIDVIDNGIGFHEQYTEKIFKVFQRLHVRNQYAGNGIGLSICKKIVQNHKGIIYANSIEGDGSIFTVILPTN